MKGISPKLPLTRDTEEGYTLNHTYLEVIKQNLKNLILTNPGERIMDINFGVGLQRFLFEQNGVNTYSHIASTIREQVDIYMPQVEVNDVKIIGANMLWTDSGDIIDIPPEDATLDGNEIKIELLFTVAALNKTSVLSFGV